MPVSARAAMESGQLPARFRLALARKDADLMLAAGTPGGVMLPVLAAIVSAQDAVRAD